MKVPVLKDCVRIGKITQAKGLKGELRLHLFAGEASWMKPGLTLFLGETLQGFSVKDLKVSSSQDKWFLKLEGLDDRTTAEKWVGHDVYLLSQHLKSLPGEKFFLREILSFMVRRGSQNIGVIVGFETNGSQDLLVVRTPQEKEVLIPLVKDFIVRIDTSEKAVYMDFPEGLLEVNS